jgi:hypothetical protein
MAKTGKKCDRKARENGYCGYHKGQADHLHLTLKDAVCVSPMKEHMTKRKEQACLTPVKEHMTKPKEQAAAIAKRRSLHEKQGPALRTTATRIGNRPVRAVNHIHSKNTAVTRENMISAIANKQTLLRLQEVVDMHATYDKIFIGKASAGNPPEKRWSQKYDPLGYEHMEVLCETPTVEGALWLEKQLIAHFKRVDNVNIQNPIAGGGGAKGKNPGYVYLVLG